MTFFLFLILNAILLLRPEELFTGIQGLRLYYFTIIVLLLFTLPQITRKLSLKQLLDDPILFSILSYFMVCVVGSVILLGFRGVFDSSGPFDVKDAVEMSKALIYCLIMICVLDSPHRFRIFFATIVMLTAIAATLSLMTFHEYLDFEALRPISDRAFDAEGKTSDEFKRLVYSGIYHDPNDFSMLLSTALILCVYLWGTGLAGLRALAMMAVPSIIWALIETRSRGGLLCLVAGLIGYLASRFGWKKLLPIIIFALPVFVYVSSFGRQTDVAGALTSGTGMERLKLWAQGLGEFMQGKYFFTGIGFGQYQEKVIQVAHNSYVHSFVEGGFFGGALFASAFILAIIGVRLSRPELGQLEYGIMPDDELIRMKPYIMGLIVSYMAGMYSLTRNYVTPTYMLLGLVSCYLALTLTSDQRRDYFHINGPMLFRMLIWGVGVLAFIKVFLMIFVRF